MTDRSESDIFNHIANTVYRRRTKVSTNLAHKLFKIEGKTSKKFNIIENYKILLHASKRAIHSEFAVSETVDDIPADNLAAFCKENFVRRCNEDGQFLCKPVPSCPHEHKWDPYGNAYDLAVIDAWDFCHIIGVAKVSNALLQCIHETTIYECPTHRLPMTSVDQLAFFKLLFGYHNITFAIKRCHQRLDGSNDGLPLEIPLICKRCENARTWRRLMRDAISMIPEITLLEILNIVQSILYANRTPTVPYGNDL